MPQSRTEKALAVRCQAVTKDFGSGGTRVQALRGINLDVYAGEMTLLVGPSGCGKTTLLSVIAGILEPTTGSVEVLGTDLIHLAPRQVVRFRGENIGFVFQQFNLLPALNATENVAVPLLIAGIRRRKRSNVPKKSWNESGLPTGCTHCRPIYQAVSSSAWPSARPCASSPFVGVR